MKITRLALTAAGAGALALAGLAGSTFASAPYDFTLGQNAEEQACRAQTRFGRASAGRRLDIYCGEWERPSGRLTMLPASRANEALAALQQECAGETRQLSATGLTELRQVACQGESGGLRRFGLFARQGNQVLYGTAFPADWGPLVHAAMVLVGSARPVAASAQLPGETAGLQEIRSVYPEGPPGQGAAANYELLRRRAYEKNAIWNFGAAERDFAELLASHRAVSPDDVVGEAEIMAEIALNLSGARRFEEAADMLRQAEAKAAEAGDPLLGSKILNYRAMDLMNQRRFGEALETVTRANQTRAALAAGDETGGLRISAADARAANARARPRGVMVQAEGMTDADRTAIMSAQGYYVAGTAARALGRPEARQHLERAVSYLSSTQVPPAWLTALVRGELARVRLAGGDAAGAQSAAQQGLEIIRSVAPRTRAEGHLLLTLARVQRQSGQAAEALATGRRAVEIFASQRETPGMPSDVAAEHLEALYAAWAANPNPALAAEYFETMALVWDGAAARSAAQLAARLASREAAGEARQYQDAERAYRAAVARRQRLANTPDVEPAQLQEADARVRQLASAMEEAEATLRARSPRFLELLSPRVAASDMSAVLGEDEGYLRIVMSSTGGHGVLVTRNGVRPYRIAISDTRAEELAQRVRRTSSIQGRRLPDYDLAAASSLYGELLKPVEAELGALTRIQVDAPGALAAVPFAALVTEEIAPEEAARMAEEQDYTTVPWLARETAVASAVGPASFVRVRRVEREPEPLRAIAFGDFEPAPEQVATRLAASHNLSDRCKAEVERSLRRLSELPSTAQEAQATAGLFGNGGQARLGENFTDQAFFTSDTVDDASVIMLATHGVLGLSDCFPEPALLASVGQEGDGLIEASELLDRRLSAELVVLSACDTAGGGRADITRTGLSDGGEALSGLARGFLYAGASSVLATQWRVDAEASASQVERFFQAALQERLPMSRALAEAQKALYETSETAHPFYWAGFVLIGDGGAMLQTQPAQSAE